MMMGSGERSGRRVAVTDPWQQFGIRLKALLATCEDNQVFTLHIPTAEGTTRRIPIRRTAEYAQPDNLVPLLRDKMLLPHPELMTVSARNPELADRLDILGLTRHRSVVDETVLWPQNIRQLRSMVLAHLRERFPPLWACHDDGDIPLLVDGVAFGVEIPDHQPAVILKSPVLSGVRSVSQADAELNILNRDSLWVRWVRYGRTVWQELTFMARPFVPEQLDAMMALFVETVPEIREELGTKLVD